MTMCLEFWPGKITWNQEIIYTLSTFKNAAFLIAVVEIILLELFCLVIKNMTAAFCHILKGTFLLACDLHDVAN